jgi:hypothetical protein
MMESDRCPLAGITLSENRNLSPWGQDSIPPLPVRSASNRAPTTGDGLRRDTQRQPGSSESMRWRKSERRFQGLHRLAWFSVLMNLFQLVALVMLIFRLH